MDDLISRQAAIKEIYDLPNCDNGYSDTYDKAYIIGVLEELPTAEKKGKWMRETGQYYQVLRCDKCGHVTVEQVRNYCPNCGARMDEEERNDMR